MDPDDVPLEMVNALRAQWLRIRDRLAAKRLLQTPAASLSLRIPGAPSLWFGDASQASPQLLDSRDAGERGALHAAILRARPDVGAIAVGGGTFGHHLALFGGTLPVVFDEQARHLGRMGPAIQAPGQLHEALHAGGNALLVAAVPVCLGTTGARLALNAELFEKCAQAFVLAAAGGGRPRPLPWLVRHVANRRLLRDERAAAGRYAQGALPAESKGY